MSYLICEKHSKSEKSGSKMLTNGYICMNRYCPESFKVLCSSCKNDHRDHSAKILSIEDVSFLVDRLLKAPFREVGRVMGETLDIMKKLKLIKEFRKKIDILEKEVQKQSLKLIDQTESLMHEYSICKESITQLSDIFSKVEQVDCFKQFSENSSQFLSNLDYNFKKDKFEYGNALIKEKQDKRRKLLENSKRKIEQVRDYSMKIIEVILHNDDSSEGEDDIPYQRKHYELLKSQLCVDKNEQELEEEISELKNSGSTTNKSRIRRQAIEQAVQTDDELAPSPLNATLNCKIDELKSLLQKEQEDHLNAVTSLSKEKQQIALQLQSWKSRYSIKLKEIDQIEKKMRRNFTEKSLKQDFKSQIMNRIVEYSQLKAATQQQKNQ